MDGRPRLVEDGPSRDGDLVLAPGAFPKEALGQFIGVLEAAGWAPKSVGPAAAKEIVATSHLVREPPLELNDRPRKVRARHAEIVPELTG